MQIKNKIFPYPIILEDGGNYQNSSFNIDVFTPEINDGILSIKGSVDFRCNYLQEQINKGNARLYLNISQKTYRKVFKMSEFLSLEGIRLKVSDLMPDCNIEIVPTIIAIKDFIMDYNPDMDEVFSLFNESFEIKKTAILGYGSAKAIPLPTDDKISSIFTLSKIKDPSDIQNKIPYKIDLNGNVINIQILPQLYDDFVQIRQVQVSSNKLINALFVYPAVQMAITAMANDYDSYRDYKWCIAISNKIAGKKKIKMETVLLNSNWEDIIDITNSVLGDLLMDAFSDMRGDL